MDKAEDYRRKLKTAWTVEMAQDLSAIYGNIVAASEIILGNENPEQKHKILKVKQWLTRERMKGWTFVYPKFFNRDLSPVEPMDGFPNVEIVYPDITYKK